MKKVDVKINAIYYAKVSGKVVTIKIKCTKPGGGWWANNETTGREVNIRTAARLRTHVKVSEYLDLPAPKLAQEKKPTTAVAIVGTPGLRELFAITELVTGVPAINILEAAGNPTEEQKVIRQMAENARQEEYPAFMDEVGQDGKTFAEFLGGKNATRT